MTLFLLSISCISRYFLDVVDYTHQLSLNFQGWFLGLQILSFQSWFMDQQRHSVFDNSMRQPWLYFAYQFDVSVMNSFMLSIPYVSCHLVFSDNFKVYDDSVFADDLYICYDIAFFTIPCVGHDSIFAIDSIRQLALSFQWWFQVLQWISFCHRFDASVLNSLTLLIPYVGCHSVFIDGFKVYGDSVFADDL